MTPFDLIELANKFSAESIINTTLNQILESEHARELLPDVVKQVLSGFPPGTKLVDVPPNILGLAAVSTVQAYANAHEKGSFENVLEAPSAEGALTENVHVIKCRNCGFTRFYGFADIKYVDVHNMIVVCTNCSQPQFRSLEHH